MSVTLSRPVGVGDVFLAAVRTGWRCPGHCRYLRGLKAGGAVQDPTRNNI